MGAVMLRVVMMVLNRFCIPEHSWMRTGQCLRCKKWNDPKRDALHR